MNVDSRSIPLEEKISEAIRTMPEQSVPDGFSARVMTRLAPKRPSLATRIRLWLTEPRSVTFTPARAIPVLALAMAVLLVGVFRMPCRACSRGRKRGLRKRICNPARAGQS